MASGIKQTAVRLALVEFIPEPIDEGFLYVSPRFGTAVHLCACGCGREVVTPLSPAGWRMSESYGLASLWPSIGNWNFPCQSHYWIQAGRVVWDRALNPAQIRRARERDRKDLELHIATLNKSKSDFAPKPISPEDYDRNRGITQKEGLTRTFLRKVYRLMSSK